MDFSVPLFDLSYNNRKIKDHIFSVIEKHIQTSTYILGPDVELFEKKFLVTGGAGISRHSLHQFVFLIFIWNKCKK